MGRTKKQTKSIFAVNLKKLLADREITQKQAAILAEVSTSVVHDWLNGTSPQDLVAVAKLAKALNCDFQFLLTSVSSNVESASLADIFNIEDESVLSGIFQIEAKKLIRKKRDLEENG